MNENSSYKEYGVYVEVQTSLSGKPSQMCYDHWCAMVKISGNAYLFVDLLDFLVQL